MNITVAEYRQLLRKPRKYRNSPTRSGDHKFASRKEARRYEELVLLQRAGAISGLSLQPRFRLEVNGYHICDYIGDFEYRENGERVIEDTKGYRTPEYRIKCKLMRAIYGIEVRET